MYYLKIKKNIIIINYKSSDSKRKNERIRQSQVKQRQREWRMVSGRGGEYSGGAMAHLPAG